MTVSDAGIGVAPDELPRLFERTFRSACAREQGIEGAGLGLYITRQIVEAHGGSIVAQAGKTTGLSVRFTVPMTTTATTVADASSQVGSHEPHGGEERDDYRDDNASMSPSGCRNGASVTISAARCG